GGGDEEVVVLEVAEHADVPGEREDQEELAAGRRLRPVDGRCEQGIPERRAGEQEDEGPVPPAVEDVAGKDDEGAPAVRPGHRQPRERQDEQKEDGEGGGREEHAGVRLRRPTDVRSTRSRTTTRRARTSRGQASARRSAVVSGSSAGGSVTTAVDSSGCPA